jgi:hypothetical protein
MEINEYFPRAKTRAVLICVSAVNHVWFDNDLLAA